MTAKRFAFAAILLAAAVVADEPALGAGKLEPTEADLAAQATSAKHAHSEALMRMLRAEALSKLGKISEAEMDSARATELQFRIDLHLWELLELRTKSLKRAEKDFPQGKITKEELESARAMHAVALRKLGLLKKDEKKK